MNEAAQTELTKSQQRNKKKREKKKAQETAAAQAEAAARHETDKQVAAVLDQCYNRIAKAARLVVFTRLADDFQDSLTKAEGEAIDEQIPRMMNDMYENVRRMRAGDAASPTDNETQTAAAAAAAAATAAEASTEARAAQCASTADRGHGTPSTGLKGHHDSPNNIYDNSSTVYANLWKKAVKLTEKKLPRTHGNDEIKHELIVKIFRNLKKQHKSNIKKKLRGNAIESAELDLD